MERIEATNAEGEFNIEALKEIFSNPLACHALLRPENNYVSNDELKVLKRTVIENGQATVVRHCDTCDCPIGINLYSKGDGRIGFAGDCTYWGRMEDGFEMWQCKKCDEEESKSAIKLEVEVDHAITATEKTKGRGIACSTD